MKKYELMFIINPKLEEEERDSTIVMVEDVLKKIKATVIEKEILGLKKLAYEIDKHKTGFYVLMKFQNDGQSFSELETKLNLSETVIRYLIVKI